MVFCNACGKENDDNAKYCSKCGHKLEDNNYDRRESDDDEYDSDESDNLLSATLIGILAGWLTIAFGYFYYNKSIHGVVLWSFISPVTAGGVAAFLNNSEQTFAAMGMGTGALVLISFAIFAVLSGFQAGIQSLGVVSTIGVSIMEIMILSMFAAVLGALFGFFGGLAGGALKALKNFIINEVK